MPTSYTPLRYPGGKAKFGPYLAAVLRKNSLVGTYYAEPYAGGAGAGLFLLFRGYASRIQLNDIDRGVVSFWRAVLNQNEYFARRVEHVPLSVPEWDRQKKALQTAPMGFDLGFAFFYLNRTNRSGIMNGGIIGGRSQQGEWGIDARFNRTDLARRVRAIGSMRRYLSVTRLDALDFLQLVNAEARPRHFVYLDPPYYTKGRELYLSYYSSHDHGLIADRVRALRHPWIVTYDDCHEIRSIYKGDTLLTSELSYSAREVRRGKEVVIFCRNLAAPKWVRAPGRGRAGFSLGD